jgi:hypothetical protein
MTASYPRDHTIQFTSLTAPDPEYSLTVSVCPSGPGRPTLMFQIQAPMKILTPRETQDFLRWLSEQFATKDQPPAIGVYPVNEEWQREELANINREMEEALANSANILEVQFRALAKAQSQYEPLSPQWEWYMPRVYGAWTTWQKQIHQAPADGWQALKGHVLSAQAAQREIDDIIAGRQQQPHKEM